ncbi:hypothetical protein B0H13DRAFT_1883312 [Mycena leptocephala]|nr:hypothetical protein B0H13DRAFT_1883312 [Mycena leptocephala]
MVSPFSERLSGKGEGAVGSGLRVGYSRRRGKGKEIDGDVASAREWSVLPVKHIWCLHFQRGYLAREREPLGRGPESDTVDGEVKGKRSMVTVKSSQALTRKEC